MSSKYSGTNTKQRPQMGLCVVMALLLTGPSMAQEAAGDVLESRGYGNIDWATTSPHGGASLVVSGPDAFLWEQSFDAGSRVDFNFAAVSGGSDGLYKYEVTFYPALTDAERAGLENLRGLDDELVATRARSGRSVSGTFRVTDGVVVDSDLPETTDQPTGNMFGTDPEQPGPQNQLFNENLYVRGSQCLGFDCVNNGEAFGFDTLRLKENNLRIRFVDTSAAASFPSNDWQITVNDSANGGLNKFSIEDISGGRTPFTIEAGARNSALYVENSGEVGIGTTNPVGDVHMAIGDTPTVRLEQNGSSGFTPQTWDVAGNEVNFFIRDATNGSRLPFRIRSGAPTSSVDIATDGDVGIGTASPDARLHVRKNDLPNRADLFRLETNGAVRTSMTNTASGVTWSLNNSPAGHLLITDLDAGPSVAEFRLRQTGDLIIAGTLTENSDRNTKTNIESVDVQEVLDTVTELDVTRWSLKAQPETAHIGPMAQDFYAAFGLGETETKISPRDVAGVALLAIQGLVEEKDREIADLKAEQEATQARLAALEAKLEELALPR